MLPTILDLPEWDDLPYTGSLHRRETRSRRYTGHSVVHSEGFPSSSSLYTPSTLYTPSSSTCTLQKRRPSSECTLRRANTVCAPSPAAYLQNKCKREMARPQSLMSAGRPGFELGDILDEILGASQYRVPSALPQPEHNQSKWQSFKKKLTKGKQKENNQNMDNLSDSSTMHSTRWGRVQRFVKVKLARLSQNDVDMGGFEEVHWRSLETRQFHRGTRRTKSVLQWDKGDR